MGATDSPPDRFILSGRSARLDPRIYAVRGDIADLALAGVLFAPHYARPLPRICLAPYQTLHAQPSAAAAAISQVLRGEQFAIVDISGDWAWGYTLHDHYVGYVPAGILGEEAPASHRIVQRSALIFAAADARSPVLGTLPMGARFPAAQHGDFLEMPDGHVHIRHAAPLDDVAADPVAFAEKLVGTPYYWGGRGGDGIDCSGLVQIAHGMAGIALPRDSDLQLAAAIGRDIPAGDPLRRGDLIFLPGHVAMMVDAENAIHASGHAMTVTIEPLATLLARFAQEDGAVLAQRRLS
ncbi:MAG: hypothetical protein ABS87_06030 [Sphingomonas sp. SCN 67-18]|uniref:C40 family peptidase n=1 Tax=uncultured Sphingomonas sp. TaxID=158754 RepID=UPI00086EC297|nr:NlpC/P60 family protein [Sphingomonas sp. SCN 67-18]ODU21391.1 MAG: hypothetical protein ABS87_06030 [Sphingomonas sp. SCN 67-18]